MATTIEDEDTVKVNFSDELVLAAKTDIWAVLDKAPCQASAVLNALNTGRIDGLMYYGKCCCLLGTIRNAQGYPLSTRSWTGREIIPGRRADSSSPAELWFCKIMPGHTPENNEYSALAAQWIAEWIDKQ